MDPRTLEWLQLLARGLIWGAVAVCVLSLIGAIQIATSNNELRDRPGVREAEPRHRRARGARRRAHRGGHPRRPRSDPPACSRGAGRARPIEAGRPQGRRRDRARQHPRELRRRGRGRRRHDRARRAAAARRLRGRRRLAPSRGRPGRPGRAAAGRPRLARRPPPRAAHPRRGARRLHPAAARQGRDRLRPEARRAARTSRRGARASASCSSGRWSRRWSSEPRRLRAAEPELRLGWTYPEVHPRLDRSAGRGPLVLAGAGARCAGACPGSSRAELPELGVQAMWVYHPLITARLVRRLPRRPGSS